MFRFFALLVLAFLATSPAGAACLGVDLRDHLSPQRQTWLDRQMAATPFSNGNHWVARKENRTLHIIGTMHGGDSRMAKIMRTLRPVIAEADVVYFEVTKAAMRADRGQAKDLPRAFLLPAGRTLQQLMSKESWEAFQKLVTISGADMNKVQRFQPWAASYFFVQSGCRPYGFGLRRGLDDRIEQYAIRKRIPIGGLEQVSTGYTALSRVPLRDQARMLENELALSLSNAPEDSTFVEAYFDQSVWQAFLLQPQVASQYINVSSKELTRLDRVLYGNLLGWRNRQWMTRILRIKEDRAIIAVGAAHLPGKDGILNLLKRSGYKLERAAF